MSATAGLALALASAAALNWGFFTQHAAASALPPLALVRPIRSLRLLFRSGRWLLGFSTGILGWALYVAALALAPLSLVQACSAGGLGLLAFLVAAGGVRLQRREAVGASCAVAGLALLGVSLAGRVPHDSHVGWAAVAAWVAVMAAAAALAVRPAAAFLGRGAGLGLAAGALYGAGDVATKAATAAGTRLAFVPVVLACHGLAFVCLQLGFQRGGALQTAGTTTILTNALPIVAGVLLYREGLPGGGMIVLRLLGFAAVVAGAAAVATAGAKHEAAAA